MTQEKKFSWWKFSMALTFVVGLFIALWLRVPENQEPEVIQGPTMGTVFYVRYFPKVDSRPREVIATEVKAILENINQEMSTYISDSVISQVNQSPVGEWVELPDDFDFVLSFSLMLAEKTNGAFDPTLGPLVNLWGFGPGGQREIPSEEDLSRALDAVGFDKVIEYDSSNSRVRRLHPDAYLDLSATAKGHAVDVLSDYLLSVGLTDHLVEIGGDLRTRGDRQGKSWRIGLEIPSPDFGISHRVIEVNDLAPVTSGSYRNFFEQEGRIFSHTIDFKTGRPIDHQLISVTVVDPELSLHADGWATAFMAMGFDEARILAENLDIAAFFISFDHGEVELDGRGGQIFDKNEVVTYSTSAFESLFGF